MLNGILLERYLKDLAEDRQPSITIGQRLRLEDRLRIFFDFVKDLSSLSTCKRLQVGCVIVPTDLTEVLSIGYNGVASGRPNDSCRGTAGGCGCCHAENNALVKLREATGALLLVSDTPCEQCSGLIINSRKIEYVAYLRRYRDTTGLDQLKEAGVVCSRIKYQRRDKSASAED